MTAKNIDSLATPMATHMTIEDLERATAAGEELDFSRHPLEAPELTLQGIFYPLGFRTELHTNSPEIIRLGRELWSAFAPSHAAASFDTEPIRVDVHVVDDGIDLRDCPPAPTFHMMLPLLVSLADAHNVSIANLDALRTQITLSRSTLRHSSYLKYFLLGAAPMCHIATRFTAPVHAACVSLAGRGMLLCGDSGAGKSTLAYACARAGWTYTSDDACMLLHDDDQESRQVTANCHQIRFRPSAAELFPEIAGMEITPRAAGKPSIEVPTSSLPDIVCSPTANIDFLVFLNRRSNGPPSLRPYPRAVARSFLRQVTFGSNESLAIQYASLERLLTAEVFELRYSNLDWAIDQLTTLVMRDGATR